MSQSAPSHTKYWLVHVPRYVHDEWLSVLDKQERKEVGKMVVVADEKGGLTMSLLVPSYGQGAPTEVPLKSKQLPYSTLVFSEPATEGDRAPGAVARLVRDAARPRIASNAVGAGTPSSENFLLEGPVSTVLDGKLPITPEYTLFLKRKAAEIAEEKAKKEMEVELNAKSANARQIVDLAELVREQRKRQKEASQNKTEKRVRMAENTVVAKLYQLFSKKQYYSLSELLDATQQPRTHLTSILKTYCDKQAQGEFIHQYTLKDKNSIMSYK